jgi:hypothetical protein
MHDVAFVFIRILKYLKLRDAYDRAILSALWCLEVPSDLSVHGGLRTLRASDLGCSNDLGADRHITSRRIDMSAELITEHANVNEPDEPHLHVVKTCRWCQERVDPLAADACECGAAGPLKMTNPDGSELGMFFNPDASIFFEFTAKTGKTVRITMSPETLVKLGIAEVFDSPPDGRRSQD